MSASLKTWFHQHLLPKNALTALAGFLSSMEVPVVKRYLIRYFIRRHRINLNEAQEGNPERYACFNDFFIRRLKPECRPLSHADLVSPVDGYVSEWGRIEENELMQAKGKYYTLDELLASDEQQSTLFKNGTFATLYLSPQDYHRVHMPIDATLKSMTYIPGKLFSVNPILKKQIPKLLASNERVAVFFDTEFGPMAMVLVGATLVGSLGTSWHGDIKRGPIPRRYVYSESHKLPKGSEMGYFKMGSTVILLFVNNAKIQWAHEMQEGEKIRYGQALANYSSNKVSSEGMNAELAY